MVTLAYIHEKLGFLTQFGPLKIEKWIFGQIWIYQILPNMAGDSHSTHLQYLICRFSGQLTQLQNCFQPGVIYLKKKCDQKPTVLKL